MYFFIKIILIINIKKNKKIKKIKLANWNIKNKIKNENKEAIVPGA